MTRSSEVSPNIALASLAGTFRANAVKRDTKSRVNVYGSQKPSGREEIIEEECVAEAQTSGGEEIRS